jgi:hypothetical protein
LRYISDSSTPSEKKKAAERAWRRLPMAEGAASRCPTQR